MQKFARTRTKQNVIFHYDCDIKITIAPPKTFAYNCLTHKKRIMKPHRKILLALWLGVFFSPLCHFAAAQAAPDSYFEMSETRSENLVPFPKWTGMVSRFAEEVKQLEGHTPNADECAQRPSPICNKVEWMALLKSLTGRPLAEQLGIINDWGNAHPYIEDQLNWGINDYWEAPGEFMDASGDCEDYAITKYYSLRALGIPPERMRIIIVQDFNLGGIIHAVLGIYDNDGTLLILDNQIKQVMHATKIYHYRPIFGINEDAWWVYTPIKQ